MTVTTDRGTEQFTRMDEGTRDHWMEIVAEHGKNAGRVPERILGMLRSLGEIVDGFSTDQLTHCLQTATLAEKAGADEEVIVASLCHDIGKAVTVANHGAIAAEILKPYVRDEVYKTIKYHQDFQGKHYYEFLGMDPNAREQYRGEPWFALCEQFADEWDQVAFDPNGETYDLEHFEPLVRRVFMHQTISANSD
jgi:putative nucleotidyltransferase with HDIG domain